MPKKPRLSFSELQNAVRSLLDERVIRLGEGVSRLEKFAHFWVLVVKSFRRNRCPIHASSLSYATLLALIPILAVAMGVTSSLLKSEGEDRIYKFVDQFVAAVMPPALVNTNETAAPAPSNPARADLPEMTPPPAAANTTNADVIAATYSVAGSNQMTSKAAASPSETNSTMAATTDTRVVVAQKEAARHIHAFIQNTYSGTLGIVGMLALVYVAIRMLASIEETFNDIWGVTRGRNWFVRIIQYWATITLGPLLLACALGLAGGPHLLATKNFVSNMPYIGTLVFSLLPLVVLWLTFALLYQLVPNTKVRFGAALVGGVVAGSLWHLNNVVGFLYVSRVVTNFKIYGSLGLVPVFMVGLYFSWLILLFGAQVAYAFQNRSAYLQEKMAEAVNQRGREFIALRLMTCIGQRFQHGEEPRKIADIAVELGIPTRLVHQVMQTLVAARLVVEIAGAETAYAPARPLEAITAHHILLAMRAIHGQELVARDEPARAEVYGEFARIQEAERQAASSVTMLALVNRVQARLAIASPGKPEEIKAVPLAASELQPARKTEAAPTAKPERPASATPLLAREPVLPEESRFLD